MGTWVEKPPWLVEWGGGASVENPHVQRVHYCQLLVSDFLMRCKSRRFPTIEKDMKMVLAHCGSLFLDPAALTEVGDTSIPCICKLMLQFCRTALTSTLWSSLPRASVNSAVLRHAATGIP